MSGLRVIRDLSLGLEQNRSELHVFGRGLETRAGANYSPIGAGGMAREIGVQIFAGLLGARQSLRL